MDSMYFKFLVDVNMDYFFFEGVRYIIKFDIVELIVVDEKFFCERFVFML